MGRLSGRVALVTGAAGAQGRAHARVALPVDAGHLVTPGFNREPLRSEAAG